MSCDFCQLWDDGECDFGCRCVGCAEPVNRYGFNTIGNNRPPAPWYSITCGCDDCVELEHEEMRQEAAIADGYGDTRYEMWKEGQQ